MEFVIRCKNRPAYRDSAIVQDGWTPDGRRQMREIAVPMSKSCHFDLRETTPECEGCCWRDAPDSRDL